MSEHTVYHPTFRTVTRAGLTDAQREAHKAAGWRMTPIPAADDAPPGGEPEKPKASGRKNVIKTD